MKCPHCAAENKDAAKFCGKCGQALVTPPAQTENSKPCPGCGHACKPDAKFCPKCGQNFGTAPPAEKLVATIVEAPASAAVLDAMPCPHCGAALKHGAKFCGKCGNSITAAKQEEPLPVPVTVKEIVHLPIEAAIELPKTAAAAEDKPVQILPEVIIETDKPTAPAAAIKAPPPAAEKTIIKSAANESPRTSRKVPLAPIAAGVAALVIALGTGGYFLMKEKSSPDANEAAQIKTTIQSAAASPTSPPPPLAVAPKSKESPQPNQNQSVPSVAPAPPPTSTEKPAALPPAEHPITKTPVNKHKQAERETAPTQANPLQAAIDAGMEEGEECMARKKFDCAISSSNTILRLDSRNARALEMKRKATEAQDRALSQIDIR